jgi:hypothetical protein
VTGLGVVEAQAVDNDKTLFEGGSADRDVGLHAAGCALLEVDGRIETEEVFRRPMNSAVASINEIEDADGKVGIDKRQRLRRAGNGYRLRRSGRYSRNLGSS